MTCALHRAVVATAMLCVAACGRDAVTSPIASPVPAAQTPAVTPEMLVVIPVSPADDVAVPVRAGTVTLQVAVPQPPAAGAAIVDVFEYGHNQDFSNAARHALVRTSTTASYTFGFNDLAIGRPYYWRVRASSGEMHGAWSTVRTVRVVADEVVPPTLLNPVDGAMVAGDYRFTMRVPSHSANVQWSCDFEIARDPGFGELVVQARVAEPTTAIVAMRPALADGRYYWRGRTFDHQGNMSGYTEVRAFDVRAPFVEAPTLQSPAPGASVPQLPVFVLKNGVLFGSTSEGPRYEVQLGTDPSFSQVVATAGQWAQPSGITTVAVTSNLPSGAYHWRARAVLAKTASSPEMVSAWTESRPVTLLGVVLGTPAIVDPASLATTSIRPVFTVTNASSSGVTGGVVTYRFEVSTENRFESTPVATGVVVEGPGVTRWTPSYDLPADVVLYWRVRAEHDVTSTVGPASAVVQFMVVDSQVHRYLLRMTVPAACGFDRSTPEFFMEARPVDTDVLTFVSRDASKSTNDSLILTLSVGSTFTGTLFGSATHDGRQFNFRAQPVGQPQAPATVAGVRDSTGWSGTGATWISEQIVPSTYKSCGPTNISWSMTRR